MAFVFSGATELRNTLIPAAHLYTGGNVRNRGVMAVQLFDNEWLLNFF